MKLATIFNKQGKRIAYYILKDVELDDFRAELAEEGQTLTAKKLTDKSLAKALLSCYEDQSFTLAAHLFDLLYESSIFIRPSDVSEGFYDAARMVYSARNASKRLEMTKGLIEDYFIDPLSECRKPMNGA